MSSPSSTWQARSIGDSFLVLGGSMVLAVVAAWGLPSLDRAFNPSAPQPGLISFLGVGLTVLALTALLLLLGLRRALPRTGVFLGAALVTLVTGVK